MCHFSIKALKNIPKEYYLPLAITNYFPHPPYFKSQDKNSLLWNLLTPLPTLELCY